MRKQIQKGLIVVAGVITVPSAVSHADHHLAKPECKSNDRRFPLLKRFFHNAKSPVERLTPAFLYEADHNRLDWRLLPSLAFVESGAGRAFRDNNLFGWDNGARRFRSVREGIHFVAERLANGRHYRGKSIGDKLEIYNPVSGYRQKVESVMVRISPHRRPGSSR